MNISALSELCEPDGEAATVRIFGSMGNYVEAVLVEEFAIFLWIEACVIQGFSGEGTDRFSIEGAAGEHERGARGGMGAEDRKHSTLIVVGEVKETVPGKEAVEGASERQGAHVRGV